jgi:hypothetical protein
MYDKYYGIIIFVLSKQMKKRYNFEIRPKQNIGTNAYTSAY